MTTTAPVGIDHLSIAGSAQTEQSSATACSVHLQAQERACLATGLLFGSDGSRLDAQAVVAIDPETGEAVITGSPALAIDLADGNRLDLVAPQSGSPVAWRGWLQLDFTYEYEP